MILLTDVIENYDDIDSSEYHNNFNDDNDNNRLKSDNDKNNNDNTISYL
jgi:hypothetical protein